MSSGKTQRQIPMNFTYRKKKNDSIKTYVNKYIEYHMCPKFVRFKYVLKF